MPNQIPFDYISYRYHRKYFDQIITFYEKHSQSRDYIEQLKADNFLTFISRVRKRLPSIESYLSLAPENINDLDEILLQRHPLNKSSVLDIRDQRQRFWPTLFKTYYEFTSGNTDDVFGLFRSSHSVQREHLRLRYLLSYYARHLGMTAPMEILYLSHYTGASSHQHIDQISPPLSILKHCFELDMCNRFHEISLQPNFVLSGTPSSLELVMSMSQLNTLKPSFIITAGEHLPEPLKKSLTESFNCPVFELYVMREFGLLGFQCIGTNAFHFFEQDLVILANENEGIIVTDMTNEADIFLNYSTGDYGNITTECRCDEAFKLIENFEGRPFGKPIILSSTIGW